MTLADLGLAGLQISDFTAWFGWLATILLTFNFALGVLQPIRYDPAIRWPHRRLPASIFQLHKWTGYSAIGVVLAHPIFLLWHPKKPFALFNIYVPFTAPAETLLASLGTIAFYLLTTIVVTSYLRVKLGLKLWKLVHYVTYALLPVFLVHGLLINSQLDPKVPIDYFDAGKLIVETCAIITIAMIVWRLAYRRQAHRLDKLQPATPVPANTGVPAASPWQGKLRLAEVTTRTPNVQSFRFVPEDGRPLPFSFLPGQYLKLLGIRNYTISSSPAAADHIELTIKRETGGFFSRYMHDDLKVGDALDFEIPFGQFTFTGNEADSVVMIAGGVGITPSLSMIRQLAARAWHGQIYLLYAVRTPADVICGGELKRLAATNSNLQIHMFFSEAGSSVDEKDNGRITAAALRKFVPEIATRRVYLCGPTAMMQAVAEMLQECAVPTASVFAESFGAPLIGTAQIAATAAQ
jgi:ferredoxin-NADP reductase